MIKVAESMDPELAKKVEEEAAANAGINDKMMPDDCADDCNNCGFDDEEPRRC